MGTGHHHFTFPACKKHERLCTCTHECNTRTMILFDRKNALPVLSAMLGRARRP